jgi:hypothetical protein
MLTYEQALAETADQRVLMRQMLAALEMVRPTVLTHGDSAEWAALSAAIAAAIAAGIRTVGE